MKLQLNRIQLTSSPVDRSDVAMLVKSPTRLGTLRGVTSASLRLMGFAKTLAKRSVTTARSCMVKGEAIMLKYLFVVCCFCFICTVRQSGGVAVVMGRGKEISHRLEKENKEIDKTERETSGRLNEEF